MDKTILIDFHNLAYRMFFSVKSSFGSFHGDAWNFFVIKSLTKLLQSLQLFDNIDNVVLCVDNPLSWRKIIYPEYKANRVKKDEDKEEWQEFYSEMDKFLLFVKEALPIGVVKVDLAEGDDIIATICSSFENYVIVSTDKDFIQCLDYGSDIKIYNPITESYVCSQDPNRELQIKCYVGDKSDNIPNVANKVGPKTAEKIIDGKKELTYEMRKNEKFNRFLIDFNFMPNIVYKNIIDQFEDVIGSEKNFDDQKFMKFCVDNSMDTFMNEGYPVSLKIFNGLCKNNG